MKNKLVAAPYLVWMAIFIVVPLGIVIYYAFTDSYTGAFTLGNIVGLGDYLHIFGFSILLGAIAAVICLLIGYPMAYAITQAKERNQRFLVMLIMLPMVMSFLLRTLAWKALLMDNGKIQQIGSPQDIYNEPKNAFVADFIGESNILDGIMHEDYVVEFFGRRFRCLDGGFAPKEPVDVVIRPEDIDIVEPEKGDLQGTVTSVTFMGVHYEIIVDFKGFKWLIQTTDYSAPGDRIGIVLHPEDRSEERRVGKECRL